MLPQMPAGLAGLGDDPAPSQAPSKSEMPAPSSSAGDFSAVDLADKFQEPIGNAGAPKKASSWRDYKEVIRIAVIGLLLIGGVVAYQLLKDGDKVEPAPVAQQPATATAQPVKHEIPPLPPGQVQQPAPVDPFQQQQQQLQQQVAAQPEPQAEVAEETAPVERTERTKTPMVTIVSSPPGALIEINGTLYGSTPLIMPSPASAQSLAVKLKLDKHKKWEGLVTANDAGHFSVNIKLEPIR